MNLIKSKRVAYSLWGLGLIGLCGLHRFYVDRQKSGVLYFFTLGFCGYGQLFDVLLIPNMVDSFNSNVTKPIDLNDCKTLISHASALLALKLQDSKRSAMVDGKYTKPCMHVHTECSGGDALDFAIINLLRFRNSQSFDLLLSSLSCDRNELFTRLEALEKQEFIYVDNREFGQPPVYCYL